MLTSLPAALTICLSCTHLVRILYLSKSIKIFPPSRALLQFIFVISAKFKNAAPSSRLCEVKAFAGAVDSLRTPFKETCENLTRSEIGYV